MTTRRDFLSSVPAVASLVGTPSLTAGGSSSPRPTQNQQTIPVVLSDDTRDTAFPNPSINERAHNIAREVIERWDGSHWRTAFGPPVATDVRTYGASGNGVTDDAPAIQAAIDATPAGTVFIPPGTYQLATAVQLNGRSNLRIVGSGSASHLQLMPTARFGFQFLGQSRNIEIMNLRIAGTGDPGVGQAAIGSEIFGAGVGGEAIRIEDCEVSHVAMGIMFDGDRHGGWQRVTIRGNFVHDCVGVETHQGYGIANSGGAHISIIHNAIDRCERHSIYQGVGGPVIIQGNTISNHRHNFLDGRQFGALEVARSHDVTICGNILDRCAGGAVSIEPHETDLDIVSANITVTGNVFRDSPDQDVFIGGPGPATSGPLRNVIVCGNTFYRPPEAHNATESIRVYHGERVIVRDNIIDADRQFTATYSAVVVSGTGGAEFTKHIRIGDNTVIVTCNNATGHFVEVGQGLSDGVDRLEIRNNQVELSNNRGSSLILYNPSVNRGSVNESGNRVSKTTPRTRG